MRESDILWEGKRYWVGRVRSVKGYPYEVLRLGVTHSVSLEAYPDASLAIARAKYLDTRKPPHVGAAFPWRFATEGG